jgi:antitoxin ParD1/3/4
MNLSLPREIEKVVESLIRSGRYESVEHVVSAAVMMLEQQHRIIDAEFEGSYQSVRERIEEGLAEIDSGNLIDGEELFEQLERELEGEEKELAKNRKSA